MKLILILLCCAFTLPVCAQIQKDTLHRDEEMRVISPVERTTSDSSRIRILRNTENKHRESTMNELFIIGRNAYKRGNPSPMGRYAPFKGHWSGFHYGFVNFTELPERLKAMELNWAASFAMQFNLAKYSINLSRRNNFGLVTGIGLEYQRLRFDNDNVSITKKNGEVTPIENLKAKYPDMETIKRSSFKTLYLTIPLTMEVQFPAHCSRRMYLSGGIMGGLRMHSKTKIVYENESGNKHKKKDKGNFDMVPFKADAIARIGYRGINVWGSYMLTNLFKDEDVHTYTVGIGFTF